tara:strand:- start:428 stop:1522 length:1095 start_codon:yes stop_codon:yes gene_type:complete
MTSVKHINQIFFHPNAFKQLKIRIDSLGFKNREVAYFIDKFFEKETGKLDFNFKNAGAVFFHSTKEEPTVEIIDSYTKLIKENKLNFNLIVAIGGGATLDVGKAVSNMLTNKGIAEDYQGWDIVKQKGVYKIGIPTISGTGAESSRTCVLTNKRKNIKMGMNSHFSVYDELILDPDLTSSVPFKQYFYTAMDTYIHCIESLNGHLRNLLSDTFSHSALNLCRKVFSSEDPQSDENRERLMLASYFGGVSIANSMVGLIHPFSAGLSSVFGSHHCVSNCIVMLSMEDYYPNEVKEFKRFVERYKVSFPVINKKPLNEKTFIKLYEATIVHEKPLRNALGEDFKSILTFEKVVALFQKILTINARI